MPLLRFFSLLLRHVYAIFHAMLSLYATNAALMLMPFRF